MANQGIVVWIYALSTFVGLVGLLGILVYAVIGRHRNPRVNRLVITGLLLLFGAQLFTRLARPLIARSLAMDSIPMAMAALSVVTSVLLVTGVTCIVLAALRRPADSTPMEDTRDWFDVRPSRGSSDNPYQPPS